MDAIFTRKHRDIIDKVTYLGRSAFAPRAAEHDILAATPTRNLQDVVAAGLNAAALREEIGGLGGGALGLDPLASLLIVEHSARYCLSTAQCLHIHYNTSHRLDQTANADQIERIIKPIVDQGAFVNNTGSEPGRTGRGLLNLRTSARKTDGGWLLNGVKNYSTMADVVHFNAISAVVTDGDTGKSAIQFFAVPRHAAGLTIEPDSWDPMGMRAAYSPTLTLKDCFVAERDVLGKAGDYARGRWTAKSHLSFAAQYVGGSEGVVDFLCDYIPKRGTSGNSHTQLRLGEIRIAIDAARNSLYHAAWLWQQGATDNAELASMKAKHVALKCATSVIEKSAQIAGSSALTARSVLSRFLRDLRYQSLHENPDTTATEIGRALLGEHFDVSARL